MSEVAISTCECCTCNEQTTYELRSPFEYHPEELPKRWAVVCDKCFNEYGSGVKTKEEWLTAAFPPVVTEEDVLMRDSRFVPGVGLNEAGKKLMEINNQRSKQQ